MYNSQSGNGIAGWGWNILGLSGITRGGKSKEIDGITEGVQFNDTDPFYLDGQRLLKINDNTFKTYSYSQIKITRAQDNNGNYVFTIQYTDGKIATYTAMGYRQYLINKMVDANGNEIHYSYNTSFNPVTPVIASISYGGKNVDEDLFFVKFSYLPRKYFPKTYRNGGVFNNSCVLSNIQIVAKNGNAENMHKNYELTYDYIEDNSIERLIKIVVKNKNNNELKPLTFVYNTKGQGQVNVVRNDNNGLPNQTEKLGSVAVGYFSKLSTKQNMPIYQVKTKDGYVFSNGIKVDGVQNDENTKLFSGKVLTQNQVITTDDQLIIANEQAGPKDIIIPDDVTQAFYDNKSFWDKDKIKFTIVDTKTNKFYNLQFQLKYGLIDIPYTYLSENDLYVTYYNRDFNLRKLLQGDFNNDGLIDFLIIEPANKTRKTRIYFIELGKLCGNSDNLNKVIEPEILYEGTIPFYDYEYNNIEFDGDGIPDLLAYKAGYNENNQTSDKTAYYVFKLDLLQKKINKVFTGEFNLKSQSAPKTYLPRDEYLEELKNLGVGSAFDAKNLLTLSLDYNSQKPLLFGDFNGDGLTDFLMPRVVFATKEGEGGADKLKALLFKVRTSELLWEKYVNTGIGFEQSPEDYTKQGIAYIKPSQNAYYSDKQSDWQRFWGGEKKEYDYSVFAAHNISIVDFNNDGRSDIVMFNKTGKVRYEQELNRTPTADFLEINDYPLNNKIAFFENKNLQGETFKQIGGSISIKDLDINPLSLILPKVNFDNLNVSNVGLFIHNPIGRVNYTLTIDNSNFLEKQIQAIDNGSTVQQKIVYRNMIDEIANKPSEATYIYKPIDAMPYPYTVHQQNANVYLVNKVHTIFNKGASILTKEYRYENGIQHFVGKGFLGFQKNYVSDAYESMQDNTGAIAIKDITKPLLWKINTKEPVFDNAIVYATYGGISTFITETQSNYEKITIGSQYQIRTTNETTSDYLKKITVNKAYTYDDYLLKTSKTDYNNGYSNTTTFVYKEAWGGSDIDKPWFYGKIAESTTQAVNNNGTFTTKEVNEYDANTGQVTTISKYGNDPNLPALKTLYEYDEFGNISKQTQRTANIADLTTTYTYDDTHRFVVSTKGPDLLTTSQEVDKITGVVNNSTSAFGLKTVYTYDEWSNPVTITDYLNNKASITRTVADAEPAGGIYNTEKSTNDGQQVITTFDEFDREIQVKTKSLNNKWVVVQTKYDVFGRKIAQSEPFFEGETAKWNTTAYDELSRPIKTTTFTNKVITTCYNGLTVTVDDGYQITSKTVDVLGNTILHQDHGGTIAYEYYPNGALKETNYEGIKTSYKIDGWGNKTKQTDPTLGEYTYKYDNLSRIITETTPKGVTDYAYDALGRVKTETTTAKQAADYTQVIKNYQYDATTKLPTGITGTTTTKDNQTLNFAYTTSYDKYFRVVAKTETTPAFTITTSLAYDAYGRVGEQTTETALPNTAYKSTSTIQNVYVNGILTQQLDKNTQKSIWEIKNVTAEGKPIQLTYGTTYNINNTYDNKNCLTNITHQPIGATPNANTPLVNIDYVYDINKGVLLSRNSALYNKKESFEYDKLNRLTAELINGQVTNTYTYDNRGRITGNSSLGKYNYNTTNYALQNIRLNQHGETVNNERGFIAATYNAFKAPLQVSLGNKEQLNFDYNIVETRYKTYSSVSNTTKYYSADFGVEITINNNSNTTQIVTYITGDPYSANYIKKEILANGTSSQHNYYLHRDNIGSIIAITDAADGTVKEQRFFDAWGNIKLLVTETGTNITNAQALSTADYFINRGYTGHEHLWRAGVIHMNARLYDPIVRKFLSADDIIPDLFNTQAYDRFGYAKNCPLLYIDPDGHFPFALVALAVAVAVTANGIANLERGVPFWYGMGKTAVVGAVSGAISLGIGGAVSSLSGIVKIAAEAAMHGISGGLINVASGGEFGSGFFSGMVSSIISSSLTELGTTKNEFGKIVPKNEFGRSYLKATMIAAGGLTGGISAAIAGGNFWDGMRQGLITAGLNHVYHLALQPKTTVAGIYGAGGDEASGNPALKELVESQGGKMFTSSVGGGDDEIIAYLREGYFKGRRLVLYGHSRGGAAAVRISNKLGEYNINLDKVILYDPVGMYLGGDFVFKYTNVKEVVNYYQRNPVDGIAFWADNPFKGSPVSASKSIPVINNIDLTGKFFRSGVLISHLNITQYAIAHP